jgi:hypothetical protein
MVGQTMSSKGYTAQYYVCRHAFDRRTGHDCTGRNVRAEVLEGRIWEEVARILSDPRVVLQELERDKQPADEAAAYEIERQVTILREREKRLVRLYGMGQVDESLINEELADVRRQRSLLLSRVRELRPENPQPLDTRELATFERACALVKDWLDECQGADRVQALEALQLRVTATKEMAAIQGVLPLDVPELFTSQHASA